ncbi:MAG: hypothetical protein K0S33_1767 [Bacteroidetes bacterium]|jgi:DUF2075 family protein|nr:hypothetical protein [Bacteroidota bacterium]
MTRFYYSGDIVDFYKRSNEEILGIISKHTEFSTELTQRDAWLEEIIILKKTLNNLSGSIFFEFSIPRMGKRIDVVLVVNNVIFILEFKVGEKVFQAHSIDQVWDYALDLKNFHETSQANLIAPILIATEANSNIPIIATTKHGDNMLFPIKSNAVSLKEIITNILDFADGKKIDHRLWVNGKYAPTPTIIEAALALYNGHDVSQISKSDASATNLSVTCKTLSEIIYNAQSKKQKCICFVTGVPGAGKTLVGLNIAAKHLNKEERTSTVFLSGNGPLVAILREALTRDKVDRERRKGKKVKKGEIFSQVKLMIQNVHHFRDECLKDKELPPFEHVAIFDEAQRAWDLAQTTKFMKNRKGISNFSASEPEFLISCLDRHKDWAVVICLVGGGQEINTGEAGIKEWISSLNRSFPNWNIYISNKLSDTEYAAGDALELLRDHKNVIQKEELHLSVSRRSFRAEHVSLLIKNILDVNLSVAVQNYKAIKHKYPIVLTRDLAKAKLWLKEKARGTERYGIVVSSQAQRLKPFAIDVRTAIDPIHWFLDDKNDTRSSYYLEDVATEFDVQGLELDWACVTWDGDFRFDSNEWKTFSFVGSKWQNIHKEERKIYLKNAYRVLLTRARQGMIIVIPNGDSSDPTRDSTFYDATYNYLNQLGFEVI